jgi:hypothetical protein
MPRDVREVYKRGRSPIAQSDAPDVPDAGDRLKTMIARTDWEILAQQTTEERRRGKRVFLRFPVEVSGSDRQGKPFCESTFTTDISATGCRAELNEPVEVGDTIAIKLIGKFDPNPAASKPQRFQIAWRTCTANVWTVGARKLTEGKFWHVEFPDKIPPKTP